MDTVLCATHAAAAAIAETARAPADTDQAQWDAGWLAGVTGLAADRQAPDPYWEGYRAALMAHGATL